tara:strand:+ start:2067 stop:2318 length:252 start_codon:yes stop_codon:yes gene_type:complete
MSEWKGRLTRKEAIRIIESVTDQGDPFWDDVVEDWYDEEEDTWPTIFHVMAALGVTESEYIDATGSQNVNWPVVDTPKTRGDQ